MDQTIGMQLPLQISGGIILEGLRKTRYQHLRSGMIQGSSCRNLSVKQYRMNEPAALAQLPCFLPPGTHQRALVTDHHSHRIRHIKPTTRRSMPLKDSNPKTDLVLYAYPHHEKIPGIRVGDDHPFHLRLRYHPRPGPAVVTLMTAVMMSLIPFFHYLIL